MLQPGTVVTVTVCLPASRGALRMELQHDVWSWPEKCVLVFGTVRSLSPPDPAPVLELVLACLWLALLIPVVGIIREPSIYS